MVGHVRTRIEKQHFRETKFAMLRTTLIALRGYRGKKMDSKHETPLFEVFYNLIPAPTLDECYLSEFI